MSMLHNHTVGLRKAEAKKLAEDAKAKKTSQAALIAQIVREKYGVEEA